MTLIFTKGAGKYDRLEVVRSAQATAVIECPKQGIIPHDMVHYAVESTLLARGFLGRVSDGESASFSMGQEAESDGVERLVEVIQGDAWSGNGSSAQDLIDLYQLTCRARECPMLAINSSDIESVRLRMAELTRLWAAVAIGTTLELQMPQLV